MVHGSDKPTFLKARGQYQWYTPDYWCHERFAAPGVDPTARRHVHR